MHKVQGLFTVLFLAVAAPAWADPSHCDSIATNLVTNCGFETGNLTGWTLSGNTGFTGIGPAIFANTGDHFLNSGAVGSDAILTQLIPTVAGESYVITFFFALDTGIGNTADFSFFFNGVELYSEAHGGTHDYEIHAFVPQVATSSLTEVRFQLRNDDAFSRLDDVAVTHFGSTAVPEPSSIVFLVTAVGLFAAPRLKRRFRQRVA